MPILTVQVSLNDRLQVSPRSSETSATPIGVGDCDGRIQATEDRSTPATVVAAGSTTLYSRRCRRELQFNIELKSSTWEFRKIKIGKDTWNIGVADTGKET